MYRLCRTFLLGLVALSGCSGIRGRISAADVQRCDRVIEDYPKISGDPSYVNLRLPERSHYELLVASCLLEERRPERGMALAEKWNDSQWPDEIRERALQVVARANAALDKEDECRSTLERLAKGWFSDASLFTDTFEFRNYVAKDWFIDLAVEVWSRGKDISLAKLGSKLALRAGSDLLPVAVAAADANRPPGELAVWSGIVRSGQIDRARNETVLLVEEIDLRQTTVTKEDVTVSSRRADVQISGRATTEAYVPNGRLFRVTLPRVSEKLPTLKTIVAFGRYWGRRGDDRLPAMKAFTVIERRPVETADDAR